MYYLTQTFDTPASEFKPSLWNIIFMYSFHVNQKDATREFDHHAFHVDFLSLFFSVLACMRAGLLSLSAQALWLTLSLVCFSAGHYHVSIWQFVPLSLHVHGSSRGSLLRGLVVGAPAPLPERSAPPTQVQPLLPPHDDTGQHLAHHRHALHGRRRHRRQGGWRRGGQPRVRRHSGFHVGGDQSLVRHVLRLGLHVPKNLHGERRRQRAAEHPAPGQRTGLESGQATERVPLGAEEQEGEGGWNGAPAARFVVVMKSLKCDKDRHPRMFGQVFKKKKNN